MRISDWSSDVCSSDLYGGDTLFSNLALAYEGLSPQIKALIDGLQAVHRTSSYDAGKPRPDRKPVGPFASLHPLVRVHPEIGERILFVNPGTTSPKIGRASGRERRRRYE